MPVVARLLVGGIAIGFCLALALGSLAWAAWNQVEILRYLRHHPEERAKLRWPWRRQSRRSLGNRG